MIKNIKVPFGELNIFPFFMDYDFVKKRPRGFSTKFSFFSYGHLCDIVDSAGSINDILFVKKETLCLKNGFFLVDYEKVLSAPNEFIEKLQNLNFSNIYLEGSTIVDFADLFQNDDRFNVFLLEII